MANCFDAEKTDHDVAAKMKELSSLNEAIAKQQAVNDVKEMQNTILENLIQEEEKMAADGENDLKIIKEFISSNRKHLCDNVRTFNNEFGIQKIISNINEAAKNKRLHKNHNDSFELNEIQEVQLAREENQQLRKLLAYALSETEICQSKLTDLEKKVKILEVEYKEGSEFLRLKSAIALSMQQTKELEIVYNKLLEKASQDSNDAEILNNQIKLSQEKSASNALSSDFRSQKCITNGAYDPQPITVTSADFEFSQAWKEASSNRSLERFSSFMNTDSSSSQSNDINLPKSTLPINSTYKSKTFTILETSRIPKSFRHNSQNSLCEKEIKSSEESRKSLQEDGSYRHTTYRNSNKFTYQKPKKGD